jgi:hypothetical protein
MLNDDIRALRANADAIYTTIAALPVIAKNSRQQALKILQATLNETAEIKVFFDRVRHLIVKHEVPVPGIFDWEKCGSALEGACSLHLQVRMLVQADDGSGAEWMAHPYGWDFQLLAKIAREEADELLREEKPLDTKLLSLKDFSRKIGLSYRTLKRMKANKELPQPKIQAGKRAYWTRDQIDEYIKGTPNKVRP